MPAGQMGERSPQNQTVFAAVQHAHCDPDSSTRSTGPALIATRDFIVARTRSTAAASGGRLPHAIIGGRCVFLGDGGRVGGF
jgi:hypothetical protein